MKKATPLSAIVFVLAFGSMAQEADELAQTTARLRLRTVTKNEVITGWGAAVAVDLSDYGISRQRYLLSAAHLVLNKNGKHLAPGELCAEIGDDGARKWIHCKVVAVDDKADLCLLEAPTDLPEVVKLGDGSEKIGEEVMIVGCPSGVAPRISRGKLTTKTPNVEGNLWQAAAKFWHGNSGGPVFNPEKHTLCGIAVAGVRSENGDDMDPNVALFAPMGPVRRFLNNFSKLNN